MIRSVLFAVTAGALATTTPPPTSDKAGTARWLAQTLSWGVLTTISTRSDGTSVRAPFGNPYSYADVDGVPYIFASDLDASMVDVSMGSAKASLALSEATLKNDDGSAALSSCDIHNVSALGDPENPPCARLVLSGSVSKVTSGSDEEAAAKASLFARHPSFKNYPSDFYIAKLEVSGVWLIDFYGGAAIIPPAEYFNASAAAGAPPKERAAIAKSETPALDPQAEMRVDRMSGAKPPSYKEKAKTARWMVEHLTWGVLSTISTRSEATSVGAPFGNPYAFADVGGVPYLFATDMDSSMIDLFVGRGANSTATLALSEAALEGNPLANCKIGTYRGDPENPPCARLVLSGTVSKVTMGSAEEVAAKASLFARHPSFAMYPPGHDFYVAKLTLTGIWLIDIYGGAAVIKPSAYFAASGKAADAATA